jgi:hypothetical protein
VPLRTATKAVATALAEAQDPSEDYRRHCDHFVGICYGLAHSGYESAIVHWKAIPGAHKHSGPPVTGGVAYWDIGTWGHTAIVVAPGTIASNDIVVKGRISVVRIGRIEESWRTSRYLGWADPYFHGSWIDLAPDTTGAAPPAKGTVSLTSVQAAAITDPPAPQGHLTDLAGTLLVERALAAEGLLDERFVDGSFGRRTVEAYAAWQRGLSFRGTSADGIPGIKTLTALGFRHGFTVVR